MKCKNCNSCVDVISEQWCYGVKEPFKIKDIEQDCTEYKYCVNKILQAIQYFEEWIKEDLKELAGDTKSDYAKFILNKHKHINTAIEVMKINSNR
jgi:hypothetical protein